MRSIRCVPLAVACAAVLLHDAAPARAQDGPGKLTIDRLYSLPRLIGTSPRRAAWAPDSRRFAFLWNDEGTNFYDVWTASVETLTPSRVTRMPRVMADAEHGWDLGPLYETRFAFRKMIDHFDRHLSRGPR